MKALKILLFVVLGFAGLFIIVSIFLSSEFQMERSIDINGSVKDVFDQTNVLKNWEQWNPWMELDPDMELTYEGPESGVGAAYSWVSDNVNVGSGSLKILESEEFTHIMTEITYDGKRAGGGYWNYDEVDGTTTVTWGMIGELSFFERILGIFMRGMMEDLFDNGLEKIKNIVESMPKIDISVMEVTSQSIIFITDSAKISSHNISDKYQRGFGEIGAFVKENDVQMAGMPVSIARVWEPDNDRYVFEMGFPVMTSDKKLTGRMSYGTTYAGNTVRAIKYGPYAEVAVAYEALEEYIKLNDYTVTGSPWEVYVNDPTTVKPEEIETHIYFPIK